MIPLQAQEGRDDGRAKCLTRLVLPIRYCFSSDRPKHPGEKDYADDPAPFDWDQWIYRRLLPENLEDIWRRSAYFTVDSSYALFRRAHWYRLEPVTKRLTPTGELIWTSFSYPAPQFGGKARNIKVEISPPAVVLFDAESSRHWCNSDPLFQVGFLCLDCHLSVEKPNEIHLEDLLEFNERARCLWLPYKGYGEGYLRVMAGCRHLWPQESVLDHFRSCLGLWSAALHYPLARDGNSGLVWFTKREMREKATAWAVGRGESVCEMPNFPEAAQPVPKDAAAIESHTGWLAATDYRAFVWSYAYTRSSLCEQFGGPIDRPERYGYWVKFMNVDAVDGYWDKPSEVAAKTEDASAFEQDWARERTYTRWA